MKEQAIQHLVGALRDLLEQEVAEQMAWRQGEEEHLEQRNALRQALRDRFGLDEDVGMGLRCDGHDGYLWVNDKLVPLPERDDDKSFWYALARGLRARLQEGKAGDPRLLPYWEAVRSDLPDWAAAQERIWEDIAAERERQRLTRERAQRDHELAKRAQEAVSEECAIPYVAYITSNEEWGTHLEIVHGIPILSRKTDRDWQYIPARNEAIWRQRFPCDGTGPCRFAYTYRGIYVTAEISPDKWYDAIRIVERVIDEGLR